jgi:Protein of unknown function (DUF1364)
MGAGSMSNLARREPLGLKQPPLVSPALRKSAQGETCTLRLPECLGGTETTILAHLRFFGWAGIAQKPADFLAVYACQHCHDVIDRRAGGQWGYEDILRALGETLMRHHAAGRMTFGGPK